eukprot:CAMPEP_0198660956 /NCGR_PEP_ID=MMETSP1467-20131203/39308_1 /TAXON_ID=1462469 /ORGANISM="unid. sp., Strain CCMP2135" /LENGTH=39 /DNA_ID= /DNA_START= /DNA_END= /DNA_ORIENTATION=
MTSSRAVAGGGGIKILGSKAFHFGSRPTGKPEAAGLGSV